MTDVSGRRALVHGDVSMQQEDKRGGVGQRSGAGGSLLADRLRGCFPAKARPSIVAKTFTTVPEYRRRSTPTANAQHTRTSFTYVPQTQRHQQYYWSIITALCLLRDTHYHNSIMKFHFGNTEKLFQQCRYSAVALRHYE